MKYLKRYPSVRFDLAALVLIYTLCVGRLQATPVVVIESGDFSGNVDTPTVISPALEVGTNQISGSVSCAPFVNDQDYFRVVLTPNTRLAGVVLTVQNYMSTGLQPSAGTFELLPASEGNSGMVTVAGNGTQSIPITVGNPDKLIFHAFAPVPFEFGNQTAYSYQVQLIVVPVEAVPGTAIHTAVEITFPSEAGQYYQLQCSSDLNSDAWANLGARIQGQGGTLSAFDTTRHAGQRFYRVVKQ